jgi:hypothetical protein
MPRLTPAERATLFHIEAHLIAQDPSLAVRMKRLWTMSAVGAAGAPTARPLPRIPRSQTSPCPASRPRGPHRGKVVTAIVLAALAVATAISVAALVLTARHASLATPHLGAQTAPTAAARIQAWTAPIRGSSIV